MWFLLFVGVPLLDLYLLVKLATIIGFFPTLAIVLVTGVGGWHLLKRQGLGVWSRAQERMASGDIPADEMMEGVALVAAGAFLVTPGVITDVTGVLLLIPPVRRLVVRVVKKRLAPHVHVIGPDGPVGPDPFGPDGPFQGPFPPGHGPSPRPKGKVIDADWEE